MTYEEEELARSMVTDPSWNLAPKVRATLERLLAERDAAGQKWPQSLSTLEQALGTFPHAPCDTGDFSKDAPVADAGAGEAKKETDDGT